MNVCPGPALLRPQELGNPSGVKIVPAKSAAKPCSWTSCMAGFFWYALFIFPNLFQTLLKEAGTLPGVSAYETPNNIPPRPDLPLQGGNRKSRFPGELSSDPHCQNASNSRGAEEALSPQKSSCPPSQPQDLPKSPLPSLLCLGGSLVTPFSVLFSGQSQVAVLRSTGGREFFPLWKTVPGFPVVLFAQCQGTAGREEAGGQQGTHRGRLKSKNAYLGWMKSANPLEDPLSAFPAQNLRFSNASSIPFRTFPTKSSHLSKLAFSGQKSYF